MKRRTLLQLSAAGAAAAQVPPRADLPVDLSSRRELFIDRFLVGSMEGTELRLERPVEREAVLRFDRPWEGAFCNYTTVIRDGADFHLYYRGHPDALGDGTATENTCYAHSSDGIKWTRPSLRLFEVTGTRENNVVLAGYTPLSHNFSPFLDTRPGVPREERFKALAGIAKSGLAGFISPDGIHWKKLREEPLLPALKASVYDSQNLAFWSQAEGCYVCYYRTYRRFNGRGVRWVARSTSPDFRAWSPGKEVEFGDAPPEHLYTNQTSPYYRAPHIYVGIAARFMPGRKTIGDDEAKAIGVHPKYFNDCADAVIISTRGGFDFDRTFLEGFLRPGVGPEHWVSRNNYPALNVVETSASEMSFYVNRRYGQPAAYLARYALRLDGFSSLSAPYRGGSMTTRLLRFAGRSLELNYSTSAPGFVKVELLAADGRKLAESPEMVGDRIGHIVPWTGRADVAEFAGTPVRLRFTMKDSQLYSLRFAS